MLKFIFNKGKPEIKVEPDITFNIKVDEEAVIREAVQIAREEHVSKLADDFLQALVEIKPEPKTGYVTLSFDPYNAAREGGYQRCYDDIKEKLISMIEKEVVNVIQ
tara:strand:- start:78 stop:395 length:318 start_codon:yes stop_codon:yes gene_type:complete